MKAPRRKRIPALRIPRFPRASAYDGGWILENQMGPNVLWLAEWLAEGMDLRPGMRVLDMGCGRALSSIFLAREFGLSVWANDLWIQPSDNWKRVREAGVEDRVFPVHAEAHALPYAEGFFDAVLSLDSYHYYGTDDLYLKYFIRFLKPGGQFGCVMPGLTREIGGRVPARLTRTYPGGSRFWDPSECGSFHSAAWWRRHLEKPGLVDVERSDMLPDGWRLWVRWEDFRIRNGPRAWPSEAPALRADRGRTIGFVRFVARRKTP